MRKYVGLERTSLFVLCFVLGSFALAAEVLDPICYMNSINGTCVEALDGDTIYVDYHTALFGSEITFCPSTYTQVAGAAQIVICIDRSGSMNTTDPNAQTVVVARTFLDSIASRSPDSKVGIVIFGAGPNRTGATGVAPMALTSANIATLKGWIDQAADHSGFTPYGAALDTARRFMNRLPSTDTSRAIIFLSDGEPCLTNGGCSDSIYNGLLASGVIATLPPVHTVYFHPSNSSSTTARNTLINLANVTEGTYTDVSNASNLYTVFLDTLLTRVLPVFNSWNYQIQNFANGQISQGVRIGTNQRNPTVAFAPLHLELGENLVSVLYERQTLSGKDGVIRSFVIYRKNDNVPLTAAEQAKFDQYFTATCTQHSIVTWLDSLGQPMPAGGHYDSTYTRIYLQVERGPGTPEVQTDTVVVTTMHGEQERVVVTETGPTTNVYRGSLPVAGDPTATRNNGTVELRRVDTLFATYNNPYFRDVSGQLYDQSVDTIFTFTTADTTNIPPDTVTPPVVVPFMVVTRDTNGNGYIDKLELIFEDSVTINPTGCDTCGLGAAFLVKDNLYTWRIAGITPLGRSGTEFDLNLVESNSTSRMETDVLPNVRFGSWTALSGLSPNTSATSVVDGSGPVIRRAILDDNGTPGVYGDDTVRVEWSEPIVPGGPYTGASQVFHAFAPESTTIDNGLLNGCFVEVGARDGRFTPCGDTVGDFWINIDSAQSNIADGKGNHVLNANRRVKIVLPPPSSILTDPWMLPNPADYDIILNNKGSGIPAVVFNFTMFGEAFVTVRIYDIAGNLVRNLSLGKMGADVMRGVHETAGWDGMNGRGRFVNRGGYVAKLFARPVNGGKTQTRTLKIAIK